MQKMSAYSAKLPFFMGWGRTAALKCSDRTSNLTDLVKLFLTMCHGLPIFVEPPQVVGASADQFNACFARMHRNEAGQTE